jgi:hypothetical protein
MSVTSFKAVKRLLWIWLLIPGRGLWDDSVFPWDMASSYVFFSPEGGVGQTQAWMPTYVSILRIPQMI